MRLGRIVVGLGGVALLPAALAQAPVSAPGALEQRVARIERVTESQGLLRLLQRVDTLEAELRRLRGDFELQSNAIAQLKRRQRELYLDVDRRLQQLERAARPAPAAAPPAAAAPVAPGAAVATAPAVAEPPAPAATAPTTAGQSPPTGTAPSAAGIPAGVTPQPNLVAPAPSATASPPATARTAENQAPATSGGAAQPQSAVDPAAEQRAYQGAFDLLEGGRYEKAAKSLAKFLRDFPNGKYADNAQYWLGEAYYVTRQFKLALQEFQKLTTAFPKSPKLTHALLKIGYIDGELGNRDEAIRVLRDLIKRYPQSTAANLARKRLKQLGAR